MKNSKSLVRMPRPATISESKTRVVSRGTDLYFVRENDCTPALTLTLSPGERGQPCASPDNSITRPSFAAAMEFGAGPVENRLCNHPPGAANNSPSPEGEGRGEGGRHAPCYGNSGYPRAILRVVNERPV